MVSKTKSPTLRVLGELDPYEISLIHQHRQHPNRYRLPDVIEKEHHPPTSSLITIEGPHQKLRQQLHTQLTDYLTHTNRTHTSFTITHPTTREYEEAKKYFQENIPYRNSKQLLTYTNLLINALRVTYNHAYRAARTHDYVFVDTGVFQVLTYLLLRLPQYPTSPPDAPTSLLPVAANLWGNPICPPDSILFVLPEKKPGIENSVDPAARVMGKLVENRRELGEFMGAPPLWTLIAEQYLDDETADCLLNHHKNVEVPEEMLEVWLPNRTKNRYRSY